jgi:hypothetical protein
MTTALRTTAHRHHVAGGGYSQGWLAADGHLHAVRSVVSS